ncbi:MAG: s-methyl-5-thioribose-1-phosphate isomerase, partial [Halanaerobiales bacterium]
MIFKSLEFKEGKLFLIDQRKLPGEKEYFLCHTYQDVEYAIARMVVRGAPAIGATAAYGLYLAAKEFQKHAKRDFFLKMREASYILLKSRPTAVNLAWALKRMERIMEEEQDKDLPEIVKRLKEEADKIAREDIEINRSIGRYGRELVAEGAVILTHCNTGGLATVGYGTALGVIRAAYERDKKIHVYANETRPWLQGARLTAFELREEGIPVTVIID